MFAANDNATMALKHEPCVKRASHIKHKPCARCASHGLKKLTVRWPMPLKNVGYLNLLLANQARPTQQLDNNQARRFITDPIGPNAQYDGHEQGFF